MAEKEKFNLTDINHAIVFGAGHGIGLAIVAELLQENPKVKVFATYNNKAKADDLLSLAVDFPVRLEVKHLDPICEKSLGNFSKKLKEDSTNIDLIISSIGFLGHEDIKPEKSLNDINKDTLLKYFAVNSISSVLIGKYFHRLFPKKTLSCFASVSAKVGSIEDNRMGGWYGYRSSKSALNMLMKNMALEFSRNKLDIITLSIHPGTTITELSKPYISNTKYKLHSPSDTAKNILNVISNQTIEDTGSFLSWDGSQIPW